MITNELNNILNKICKAIRDNRDLMKYPKTSGYNNTDITAENLIAVSCGHLFDDFPELFDITERDGHKLREYILQEFADRPIRLNYDLNKFADNLQEKEEIINGVQKTI